MEEIGQPVTILFIEDDLAHAEIAMRNLKRQRINNNLIHVADGQLALDYLLREGVYKDPATSPRPDLILMDLRLPKVDGIEILKRLRSEECLRNIPAVILTTSQAESDISKAYQYNVNSYLVKPLDSAKFSKLMESFGFYWVAWNKYPQCK